MKHNDWIVHGISPEELATEKMLVALSGAVYLKRLSLNLSPEEFAHLYNVPTSKVDSWESATYNFPLSELLLIFTIPELCKILKGESSHP